MKKWILLLLLAFCSTTIAAEISAIDLATFRSSGAPLAALLATKEGSRLYCGDLSTLKNSKTIGDLMKFFEQDGARPTYHFQKRADGSFERVGWGQAGSYHVDRNIVGLVSTIDISRDKIFKVMRYNPATKEYSFESSKSDAPKNSPNSAAIEGNRVSGLMGGYAIERCVDQSFILEKLKTFGCSAENAMDIIELAEVRETVLIKVQGRARSKECDDLTKALDEILDTYAKYATCGNDDPKLKEIKDALEDANKKKGRR